MSWSVYYLWSPCRHCNFLYKEMLFENISFPRVICNWHTRKKIMSTKCVNVPGHFVSHGDSVHSLDFSEQLQKSKFHSENSHGLAQTVATHCEAYTSWFYCLYHSEPPAEQFLTGNTLGSITASNMYTPRITTVRQPLFTVPPARSHQEHNCTLAATGC